MVRHGLVVALLAGLALGCTTQSGADLADDATPATETDSPDQDVAPADDEDAEDDGQVADADGDVSENGLFAGGTLCVDDGSGDCVDGDGFPAAVCAADWGPAAPDLLAADGELTYVLTLDGQEVLAGSVSYAELRAADGLMSDPLELRYSLGGLPFPAGEFGCRIDDGHAVIEERVSNPDGTEEPVYGIATCDLADAVQAGGSQVCTEDVETFVDVTHVNCSVGVALLGDADLRAEFIWTPPADTQLFTEQRVHVDVSQTGIALHAFNLYADASAFGGPTDRRAEGDAIPAGDYTCRFSERGADETLAETSFTVAES